MRRRIGAAITGAGAALLPLAALAEGAGAPAHETVSRALSTPPDMKLILIQSVLGLGGLLTVTGIGFLYRRRRNLDWAFQRPDPPANAHH